MRPPRRFSRVVWVEGSRGEKYGIEFFMFVDSNDWAWFNMLASEFFRQRVRVNRGEKPLLPYGPRAQKIIDMHRDAVRRRRKQNDWI
jgi:hypothetical protein